VVNPVQNEVTNRGEDDAFGEDVPQENVSPKRSLQNCVTLCKLSGLRTEGRIVDDDESSMKSSKAHLEDLVRPTGRGRHRLAVLCCLRAVDPVRPTGRGGGSMLPAC
jgi:hypothetical protein